jgi:hypothetical protein
MPLLVVAILWLGTRPFLEEIVIAFMAKTWFLWWMFAIVVILRWFHALPLNTQSDALDEPRSLRERGIHDAGDFTARNAGSLLLDQGQGASAIGIAA